MTLFRLSRVALAAVSVSALASCGPPKDAFAPACPQPSFVRPLADITRFAAGGGQDITDLVLQGRILKVDGSCKYGDTNAELATAVSVSVDLQRGIAMQGRQTSVPLFIAITDGGKIVDKQIITLKVEFPSNVDRMTASTPEVDMTLPISDKKSGAAYGIIAGFQLTPDELAFNKAHTEH
jgi:hypothetical protein